ncbi:peptide/nickel transport system substrate-binding protein [Thermomonospora echinospora]|uniref:Peptide/nickel transport system substrate-binding protein n=1 Tax=Thermomonospora echinospora TaxID=1992 RepID=A0A1H6BK68_9ACTN|nr:ABC transporter family substrate-binding protein [Thermomonospora echinospora]SEG61022.1 peptide/nickel transport system substrate-binding protein [Thermomonospora echinospora]
MRFRARSVPAVAGPAGLLVGLLLVAGCAVDTGRERMPDDMSALPAYDVNPMPRERLRAGGTLRWPMPEFPTQWNFHHVNGSKGVVNEVLQGVMPYLMRSDAKGVSHPVPEYLADVEVTTAPAQVVTYTIDPRARWSDGTPITYRDFAAQARALCGRDGRYQVAAVTGYDRIASVRRGRHDRQAVVTFARPFADWRALFTPLYPAATGAQPAVFNGGWLNRLPVTAGPFKVEAIDRTAKTITIVRDPRWWGRPARLDRIVFRVLDPGAAPGAFANGEVDVLDAGGDAGAYRRALRVRGAVIRRAAGPDWRHLTFNAGGPILSDVRVRQAIMNGIDRRALAESDLKDMDWPVEVLGNHFFMHTQTGYRDNAGELGRHDPARANRLLEEAGWRRAGRYRVKDGRTLAVRFVVPATQHVSKREGELVQAMLARIGVRVDIRPVPTDDLFDRYVLPGNFDIVPFSWLGTPFPVSSNRAVFATPRGGSIQQNYSRIGSPALDAALDRAVAELDPVKVRRLVNEADRMVWRQATVLPLYQRPQLLAVRGDLANFGARGFYDLAYEDIGFTAPASR